MYGMAPQHAEEHLAVKRHWLRIYLRFLHEKHKVKQLQRMAGSPGSRPSLLPIIAACKPDGVDYIWVAPRFIQTSPLLSRGCIEVARFMEMAFPTIHGMKRKGVP